MAKKMNFKEFAVYAQKHYEKGGDTYFECWDEKTYHEFYPDGVTKTEALEMFHKELDHERDVAGYWL